MREEVLASFDADAHHLRVKASRPAQLYRQRGNAGLPERVLQSTRQSRIGHDLVDRKQLRHAQRFRVFRIGKDEPGEVASGPTGVEATPTSTLLLISRFVISQHCRSTVLPDSSPGEVRFGLIRVVPRLLVGDLRVTHSTPAGSGRGYR